MGPIIQREGAEQLEQRIHLIRGCRVMLDRDLAKVYGVSTGRLNEQIKRNKSRFPEDFAFRLTKAEADSLISQNATSSSGHGGYRKLPIAFTEHGAVAAAFVLNSPVAVSASIQIVRAFNRLRRMALGHKDLAVALAELARKVRGHDEQFKIVFETLRDLMTPPPDPPIQPRRRIGFAPPKPS
ncbi:MAG: ORF6N domain-containing protein [Elusimicrobia bacterium]|nr:ORF6N domain-containing protein [Elusimicrobiota bacterium]